ncbi:cytochrome c oxidase assembly protein COX19, putative [Plasmodium vivax]|uniref:Cytochrome c oxidase assembly protein COX19, putative n=1 Tax=Plasmodium vivax TaxID=5855 RepID=A0A1G4HI47_PLAVI|nr:cytochrome c oxidase assembly protein COX19, putative [Plasmodium vivax]
MDKKRSIVKKPERGSFLLDHNSECTPIKNYYLKCLKEHNNDHVSCREYSKEYFICRMDKNLLERQSLNDLGFSENETNHESRIKHFKDVYSYNVYNETMESFPKGRALKRTDTASGAVFVEEKLTQGKRDNKADMKPARGDDFLLLNLRNDKEGEQKINGKVFEITQEKKIAVKRKEEEGYLAGKEYIKTLVEKKKRHPLFSYNIFKSSNT